MKGKLLPPLVFSFYGSLLVYVASLSLVSLFLSFALLLPLSYFLLYPSFLASLENRKQKLTAVSFTKDYLVALLDEKGEKEAYEKASEAVDETERELVSTLLHLPVTERFKNLEGVFKSDSFLLLSSLSAGPLKKTLIPLLLERAGREKELTEKEKGEQRRRLTTFMALWFLAAVSILLARKSFEGFLSGDMARLANIAVTVVFGLAFLFSSAFLFGLFKKGAAR